MLPREELQDDVDGLHCLLAAIRRDRERVGLEDIADDIIPDEPDQEVVDDGPLEVPSDRGPGLVEPLGGGLVGERVEHAVVILQEALGELGHDQVFVVPRIAEQRPPVRVPGQVVVPLRVATDQEVDPVGVVEEGDIVGTPPVDRIEVEARRPEIGQCVRIVVALQLRRRVEREVVVHELPEIREAGGDVRIVAALILGPRLRLRLDHLLGQLAEQRVRWEERR